jgi:glycosyltransferase involved in cell wall biosynthesis
MGEPIRIAQVVGPVVLGGVDTMVMNYYRHIDRSKVQFDFIMDGYEKTPIDDEIRALGGRVYKVEPYAKNIVKSMRQYYRIFRENRYPIVHSHMNTLSVFPLFEAWRAGVPVRIAHSHSTAAKGEGVRTTMKYMLRPFAKIFPTHYCACAEYAGRWLFGDKFFDSGKVRVIKNAIDLERFSFKPQVRTQMREKLGIENKFVVGHVGRFMYQKNHDFLIDIFDEIHKQNPNSILLLIGDGPLKKQIQEKVDKLGLTNSVQFLGLRRDVPDLLQAMDVFVLPSYYEGLPVVGVEAQAAGLPCFFSDAITAETKITDLVSFINLSQTPANWAQKIVCCANDFPRTNMHQEIEKSGFDIQNAAKELEKLYIGM